MITYLVEIDTAARILRWVNAGGGVYTRTLESDVLLITAVKSDGVALTQAASAAALPAGDWYYEPRTQVLSVRLTDSSDPGGHVMIATITETLLYGPASLVKDRPTGPSTWSLFWDGRVTALPSVTMALNTEEVGQGAAAVLGQMTVQNEDGRYDRLVSTRTFAGQQVRIYRGNDTDAYTAYVTWAVGLMDAPTLAPERLTVNVVSLGRTLDNALCASTFTLAAYPAMDPAIAGVAIPKIFGAVVKATAFRTASGQWTLADHAMTAITAAYKSDGTVVTISAKNLALANFSVGATYDTESRLYADCTGYNFSKPGDLINQVALVAGFTATQIDAAAIAHVNADRNVSIGFQILQGTGRDALKTIALSSVVDWFCTRQGIITCQARRRDQGNLALNPSFETDVSYWLERNGAIGSQNTVYGFESGSVGCGQISTGGDPLAQAYTRGMAFKASQQYTATLVAAQTAGAVTTQFRISFVDGGGTEYLSDPFTLTGTGWTRIILTSPPFVNSALTWDNAYVYMNDTNYTADLGAGEFRVYPEYGGTDAITIIVDEVELVQVVAVDDTNAIPESIAFPSIVLYQARVGYNYTANNGKRQYAQTSRTAVQQLWPTAESRKLDGNLASSGDADTVGSALLNYYGAGRITVGFRLLDVTQPVDIGTVISLHTTRRPSLPAGSGLYRVINVTEKQPGTALPELNITAEGQYQAAWDAAAITAS